MIHVQFDKRQMFIQGDDFLFTDVATQFSFLFNWCFTQSIINIKAVCRAASILAGRSKYNMQFSFDNFQKEQLAMLHTQSKGVEMSTRFTKSGRPNIVSRER